MSDRGIARAPASAAATSPSWAGNAAQAKRWERTQQRSTIVKPFFVSADVAIPPQDGEDSARSRRRIRLSAPQRTVLDGFSLLEAAETELPDQATQAKVVDKGLVDTVPSDLAFFTNLQYLDASDNDLRWEGLVPLVSLEELRLACNNISALSRVPRGSFERLELLDLSYNSVNPSSLSALTVLPSLRELDLTSNGLKFLPTGVMHKLRRLEILVLESNKLESDVFESLAMCPRLRELNLGKNYVREVPESSKKDHRCYRYLQWLNLSHNYIARQQDIVTLSKFPVLSQVLLYGNPLTELSRKKKASAKAVLSALAGQAGDGSGRAIVNFVTDAPDDSRGGAVPVRVGPKQQGNLRGSYGRYNIAKVDEAVGPSNAAWREAGNRLLFHDSDSDSEEEAEAPATRRAGKEKEKESHTSYKGSNVFLTAAGAEEEDSDGEDDARSTLTIPKDPLVLEKTFFENTGQAITSEELNHDARLRGAIRSLRHALQHPITAHDSKLAKFSYERPTKTLKARQKPRVPYAPPSGAPAGGGAVPGRVPLDLGSKYTRGPGAADRSPRMNFMAPFRNPHARASSREGVLGSTGRQLMSNDAGDKWTRDRIHVASQQSKASLASLEAMLQRVEGDLQRREATLDNEEVQGQSTAALMHMVEDVMLSPQQTVSSSAPWRK